MAINVDTQDLVLFPGNVKRVVVDQGSIVQVGNQGDESFVLNFSTSAYSDITTKTKIQNFYVTNFKAGWCKSSGFSGTKFALDATHRCIEVKIDSTVSGTGSGYYRVTLNHENGVGIDGEVVAADLEDKIQALGDALSTADSGYKLAYKNATVTFKNGRFWIVSGSLSQYYTGTTKSSVKVRPSSIMDCSSLLGFDLYTDTETVDSYSVKEAVLVSDYTTTSGVGTINISANIGASVNDCLMITDRTNTDYVQINLVTGGTVITFDGAKVSHNYSANATKVQLLREQDPDAAPTLWYDSVDKLTRYGITYMTSQIDYSA